MTMQTSAITGYPYPDQDEKVMNTWSAIKALADSLIPCEAGMSRASSQNVPHSTWTALAMSATDWVQGPTGMMVPSANGIICNFNGRVRMEAFYAIGGSTAGTRRLIGVGKYNGGVSVNQTVFQPLASGAGMSFSFVETFPVVAGDCLTVWAWQDSGVILLAGQRKIVVRRVDRL